MRTRGLRAARLSFLLCGQAAATWAPLVPFAKARLGVGDTVLGVLILCLGVGSMATMPVAGWLAGRFGSRPVVLGGGALTASVLPVIAVASTVPAFAAAVLAFGAGIGTLDVGMNTEAVLVERNAGRTLMSGIHAFYSLGGLGGSALMTGLLTAGATPVAAATASALLAVVLLALASFDRPPVHAPPPAPGRRGFPLPDGPALLAGGFCFLCFLAEGAVADWGALFLGAVHRFPPSAGGLAYGSFSAAMAAGRFGGDRVVGALGPRAVVTAGSLLGAAGFLLADALRPPVLVVLSFALVGAGAANLVPVLISAAGRRSRLPTGLAVASITTLGYAGVLAGPALLGAVAGATSLSVAFAIVALLLASVGSARRVVGPEPAAAVHRA